MEHTVRFIREQRDAERERHGEPPLTDEEFANLLLSMKYFHAAEWLLGQMYAEAAA